MHMSSSRFAGIAMTVAAVAALLAAYGVMRPEPVGAYQCCQDCEAKQDACEWACTLDTLDEGEDISDCYDACSEALWSSSGLGCWSHCSYCNPTPTPNNCYESEIGHWYVCDWYDESGQCLHWAQLPGTRTIEWRWNVNSVFCTH
jgi:hypothetical protein